MMPRHALSFCASLLAITVLTLTSASIAMAQEEDKAPNVVDDSGPVVRRKLLYRSTRFEAAPLIGVTVADPFNRNVIVGANLGFHLTNEIGISLTGGYGVTQWATSLRENMDAELASRNRLGDLEYSHMAWVVGAEGSFVPFYGKFALLDSAIINYDFHLIGGVSFIGLSAVNAQTDTAVDGSRLSKNVVAPTIGAGMRFFMGDMLSLNLDFRDYIYSKATVYRNGATLNEELGNNVMLTIGLGIFLPGEVKVSR